MQGTISALYAAFGLRCVGMDELDIQHAQGPPELGEAAFALRMIDAKDAVFVGVEADRTSVPGQIVRQGTQVRLGGLCACLQQAGEQNARPAVHWLHHQ